MAAGGSLDSLSAVLGEFDDAGGAAGRSGHGLTNVACAIGNSLHCDVCSIYLLAEDGATLVLAATVGLNQDCVGRLRMRPGEGLTGLVAERLCPVQVERAAEHPRFKYFPEAGEDRYESFLGVPIADRDELEGVLVVQTAESRPYSDDEVGLLSRAGRQLGPVAARLRQGLSADIGMRRPFPV